MFQKLSHPFLPVRDAGDAPKAAPVPQTAAQTGDAPADVPAEELKATLLKAVEERARRAESSVLRSMAEQNGLPEADLAALLAQARAGQAEELPPEVQKKLDAANQNVTRRLLMAEVKSVGAELGLLDAEVALTLLDASALAVGDDGTVSGVREALENLKQRKGYLFTQAGRGAWAQRVSSGGAPQWSGVEEAFYRKNPALR